jgi:metallophosphoesterase (TIGR03767 family)
VSPARCEWIELLAHDPHWQPLLHMHRPYEALTHWALAAHVEQLRRQPLAPWSQRAYDLAISTGDNVDNAQLNELQTFVAILRGGQTSLSAHGGVHEPSAELGSGPWPFWCPDAAVDDLWKPQGFPVVPDFVQRASAVLDSPGLGFAWTSLPGNHDWMRQGTALPNTEIEAIATGSNKTLCRPPGFAPTDPLSLFVSHPQQFSQGATRQVTALAERRAINQADWLTAHVQAGALGYNAQQLGQHNTDTVIDTEHVRIIMLDTNHPAGDYQGSVGAAQLVWLEQRLREVEADPGRLAVLCSHHGSVSLTNERGADPERLHADALTAVTHRHPCLVAWLVGHRHVHRITPHAGPGGGFWEITTGSVIDWPSQTRAIEILRHRNGQLEIVCTLLDHQAQPGSLARMHLDLAQQFASGVAQHMQGEVSDGNVRLIIPRSL